MFLRSLSNVDFCSGVDRDGNLVDRDEYYRDEKRRERRTLDFDFS